MRTQLGRAEQEKKDMVQRVEEYRGKMEENEAQRKRLQGRLETLSRELEEGHGNRDRLTKQVEALRAQVIIVTASCATSSKENEARNAQFNCGD